MTKIACEIHGGDRVAFRALGRLHVVGRSQLVPVFEIAGLRENLSAQREECIAIYHDALGCYLAHDWARAVAGFERSAVLEQNQPGDTHGGSSNPSLIYLALARRYTVSPAGAEWDGSYVMTQK